MRKNAAANFGSILDQIKPPTSCGHEDRDGRHFRFLVQGQHFRVGGALVLLDQLIPRSNGVPVRRAFGPVHVLIDRAGDPDDSLNGLGCGSEVIEVQGASFGDDMIGGSLCE